VIAEVHSGPAELAHGRSNLRCRMTNPPDSPKRRLGSFKEGCAPDKFSRTKAYELINAGLWGKD
jgi:hypothetical protein